MRAVDRVSLAVYAGETVALVGESGLGKSTLGRLLLGLLPPDEGVVRYTGQDVASLRGDAWRQFRREVQVVFQGHTTVPPVVSFEDGVRASCHFATDVRAMKPGHV